MINLLDKISWARPAPARPVKRKTILSQKKKVRKMAASP